MTMPDAAAVVAPLTVLVAAGFGASVFAAVGTRFLARATFAAHAALLQSCVVVLLIVSLAALVPRVNASPDVGAPLARPESASAQALVGGSSPLAPSPHLPVLQPPVARVVVVVWLLGALVRLTRLAGGAWQLSAIRSRARRSAHHPVLVSVEVDVPFVHGVRSPTIVVPAASESWTADTWRAVLAHESAHIARGDVPMVWLREIVLALHWFNPAVRWLIRRTDEACEGACDDVVVLHGSARTQYAGTLVSFADAAWSYVSVPSMAARTGLEHRVSAILDRGRARRGAHRRDRLLPLVLGVVGGCALAFVVPRPAIALARDVDAAGDQRPQPIQAARHRTRDIIIGSGSPSAPALRKPSRARITNDTTEALLGLGQLLDDANPIVRQTASDALLAWGTTAQAALEPVARTGGGERRVRARRALATLGTQRVNR